LWLSTTIVDDFGPEVQGNTNISAHAQRKKWPKTQQNMHQSHAQ